MRLSKVLTNIVSDDQTCGVPGRTILNNVFILRDLVVICKLKNIPAAIISIEQMKAFDRVICSFIYKTLRAFGFKDTFVRWIQLLYSGAKSIVEVNGFLSDPFHIQRSVRQGDPDPLSLLFYILIKSLQSALSDLLTTSATHGTFSRPSTKRGLILIIKLLQFTIVRFF